MIDFDDLEDEEAALGIDGAAPILPQKEGWRNAYGFEQVANFRDVGLPAAEGPVRCSGGVLKRGVLFRTSLWQVATPADISKLRDEIGIRTYIDLRTGENKEAVDGPVYDEYPPSPHPRHKGQPPRVAGQRRRVHCNFVKGLRMRALTEDEKNGRPKSKDRKAQTDLWYQQQMREPEFSDLARQLSCMNKAILFLNPEIVLDAMNVLIEAANYPVAFGCMTGKDRTGLLSCLVLGALGASEEAIMEDYLLSNRAWLHNASCVNLNSDKYLEELKVSNPRRYEMQLNAERELASETAASDEENLRWARVFEEVMNFTLKVLREECGGAAEYLRSIGFGPGSVRLLREILVDGES